MSAGVKHTYKELISRPDDRNRYELLGGDLVMTPSPSYPHQNTHANLFRIMSNHVFGRGLGRVISAPFDVYFNEETVVQPDLIFISNRRSLHRRGRSSVRLFPSAPLSR